jgi:hypothetical protein
MLSWFSPKSGPGPGGPKIGFDDVLYAIKNHAITNQFLLINTLPLDSGFQDCLIHGTMPCSDEETVINDLLSRYQLNSKSFIVYGKNATDPTVEIKYKQLIDLGFSRVYMYVGGMFEWLLLQDIYGTTEFPTTKKILDILKYKPRAVF